MRDFLMSKQFLSVLFAVKLGVIGSLALVYTDVIQIGEKMLFAEEKPSASETTTPPAGDKPATEGGRKSFLEGLLELPKLDASAPKKEEIARYLTLAERKRAQIDERLAMIKEREAKLVELEKSIEDKLVRLDEERRYFATTIQKEKEFKDQRQTQIVEMYKKMEPKKAAPLFEQMDKDLVVYLFNAMGNKQVTKVLETMKPEKSVELTEYFGRVRSAREYDTLREMNKSLAREFDVCRGMQAETTTADAPAPSQPAAAAGQTASANQPSPESPAAH